MKKHLLLLAFISIAQFAFSQPPPLPVIDVPNLDCDSSTLIQLHTQAQVDSFPINYGLSIVPGCIEIGGFDVFNVDSLYQVNEITGSLIIGTLVFCFPPPCVPVAEITDLTGLSNLTSINGVLVLRQNVNLTDLTGLENINPESLTGLFIQGNNSLSQCSIESVCGYIALDSASIDIQHNAIGCDTLPEVQAACVVMDIKESIASQVSIYPNPAKNQLYISSEDIEILSLRLYNQMGQSITIENRTSIDVSHLPRGLYILELETKKEIIRKQVLLSF